MAKRHYFTAICAAAITLFAPNLAYTADDTYPNKPITLLVGYPPASATDFIARLVAPSFAEGLGQPVVVENRPGASGMLAGASFANASPDGYTLMATVPGPITIGPLTQPDALQYDPLTDFRPVGLFGVSPLLITVPTESDIKSADDLIKLAKSASDGLDIASYGVGSPSHFAVEMIKHQGGLNLEHIPFNGSSAMQSALLGGVVPVAVDSVTSALPLIEGGRVRALAITANERIDALPEVPTTEEAGLGAMELGGWAGLHAPAGTPDAIVERLNNQLNQALADPRVRQQFEGRLVIVGGTPERFAEHIRNESAKLRELVEAANLKFD